MAKGRLVPFSSESQKPLDDEWTHGYIYVVHKNRVFEFSFLKEELETVFQILNTVQFF
jgi:hypothetical protein